MENKDKNLTIHRQWVLTDKCHLLVGVNVFEKIKIRIKTNSKERKFKN